MKQLFFTPGPSMLYPTVEHDLNIAIEENIFSISHRSEKFQEIFRETTEGLRNLLKIPKEHHVIFVASGTEAMERVVENTVEKKSFHFFNGSFGKRWYEIALELGKDPKKHEVPFGEGFRDTPVIPTDTELICFTHNETSSGVAVDTKYIYAVARENPQALIAVDSVSSAPYVDLDYTKLDCVFFSVQKLFGLPAGLGVMILSPKAVEKAESLQQKKVSIGSYHSFLTLVRLARKYQTPETPNVLDIYLLGKVIADMHKKGIAVVREEQNEKATMLYDFFDRHAVYKPLVANKKDRSQTVVVVVTGNTTERIKKKLKEKGLIVGSGYGPYKESQIRIANFPAVKKKHLQKLLKEFV